MRSDAVKIWISTLVSVRSKLATKNVTRTKGKSQIAPVHLLFPFFPFTISGRYSTQSSGR